MKTDKTGRTETGRRRTGRRLLILLPFFLLMGLFVIKLNQTEIVPLTNTAGRTFEKGTVTEILEDNIQEDGTRIGEQKVKVRLRTGERKGEELTATSSAGYLFGAACYVGMKVIVIQSVSGEETLTSIYSKDRGSILILFGVLYLAV